MLSHPPLQEHDCRGVSTWATRILFATFCALVLGGISPVVAQPLEGYPHRITILYNQEPLVCPIRSAGQFGWSGELNVNDSLPEGAAGAVLWQEPRHGVMLHWEHPIYNPTTQEYTIPLRAVVTRRGAGSVLQINALWRPATRRSDNFASGPAAQVTGSRQQSMASLTVPTNSVIFRNDPIGYAAEIWVTRQGTDGCSLRLATYTFYNDETLSSNRVCRNLREGDQYYATWSRCCDIENNRSRWTRRSDGWVGDYNGSCSSWGIE